MKKLKAQIYIDGANIFYAQMALGWFIDFKKLKGFLRNNGTSLASDTTQELKPAIKNSLFF